MAIAVAIAIVASGCAGGGSEEEIGGAEEMVCGDPLESPEETCTEDQARLELAEEGGCEGSREESPENLREFEAAGVEQCP